MTEPDRSAEGEPTGGSGLDEQRRLRAAKVAALAEAGVEPYPERFDRSALAAELRANHSSLEPGDETGEHAAVAGRVMLLRHLGKLAFLTIRDRSGTIQLFVSRAVMGDEGFAAVLDLDLGDWVGAEGEIIATRTGELSIRTEQVTLLAKSLRPLPDKHKGLTDVDTRFRQRYADLIANEDARRVFAIRSAAITAIRRVMLEREFVEVETPVLQSQAGGAAAKPFRTHHDALGQAMVLRIAPELFLKRLVVGGMERVFEIGRNFRNEGIDTRHNPEFTMIEGYQALADLEDMMELVETLISSAALDALGTMVVSVDGQTVDLTPPWPRRTLVELIADQTGRDVDIDMGVEALQAVCHSLDVEHESWWGPGKLIDAIYDRRVQHHLVGPVFCYRFPAEVTPLARRDSNDPRWARRYQLLLRGQEMATAYSELNDPVEQRKAFEQQAAQAAMGDEEAQARIDEDYLRALEYGLPPTGGFGIGLDRLVMLLADVSAIREVILFPTMRPEA